MSRDAECGALLPPLGAIRFAGVRTRNEYVWYDQAATDKRLAAAVTTARVSTVGY